jgi:predicted amidohydrolase YtcJ
VPTSKRTGIYLSRDLFKIDPQEIEKANIVLTIMDGRVVYEDRRK